MGSRVHARLRMCLLFPSEESFLLKSFVKRTTSVSPSLEDVRVVGLSASSRSSSSTPRGEGDGFLENMDILSVTSRIYLHSIRTTRLFSGAAILPARRGLHLRFFAKPKRLHLAPRRLSL